MSFWEGNHFIKPVILNTCFRVANFPHVSRSLACSAWIDLDSILTWFRGVPRGKDDRPDWAPTWMLQEVRING